MYYKLPVKERMDLMRSYKKTNKDMSYSDMVNDYNTSYQKFKNGGEKPWGEMNAKERTAYLDAKEVNAKAETTSRKQAIKEHYQDYVKDSMKKTLEHPMFNTAQYFTPEGMAVGAIKGLANVGPDVAKGDYSAAAFDALTALPVVAPAVKNVYRVNPWAKKLNNPEMGYRSLRLEGYNDALESGVLRAKQLPIQTSEPGAISLARNTNRNPNTGKMQGFLDRPYFSDGFHDPRYGNDYVAEVNKLKNDLVPIATHKGIAPSTATNIPLNNATIYKQHWLKGYKEVPKNKHRYGGIQRFDNGGKMPKKEINLNIKNQEFNSPVSTWNENLDWQGEKYNDVGLNFNKKNLNIGIGNYIPRSTFEKVGNVNPYLNVSYDLNDRNSIGGNFSKDYNGVSFIRKFDNGGIKKEVRSTTDNTNVAKPYFPNPDNTNMDPRKIPQSGMVVDKRTNQAYYFGDDGDTGTFPVLTAKNPEANKNTYSLSQLAKNSNLRSTPKGYYMVEKESKYKSKDNMQHYKGLMRSLNPIEAYGESKPKASDLALHLTFTDPGNPKVFKNREHLYNQTPQKRYASYGCVNCQEPSYRAFNKAVPESDTLMMLDSNDPKDLRLLKQAQSRIKTKIKD